MTREKRTCGPGLLQRLVRRLGRCPPALPTRAADTTLRATHYREDQPVPADPTPTPAPISRRAAVRLALEALGADAPNPDLVRWVRDHHGYDVSGTISAYKSIARKRAGAAGRPRGKPGRKPRTAAPAAPPPATPARPPQPVGGLADDLTALARLAAKYGPDEVRGMLGALEAATARPR